MFRRKSPDVPFKADTEYAEPDVVEEIFEDGSAMLSKRYNRTRFTVLPLFTYVVLL